MFPYDDDEMLEAEDEAVVAPTDYGINFDRNILTGVTVSGLPALKVWARNALLTPRYRYEIFSDDYGSELETLIGHVYSQDYVSCEAKRMVTECLTVHPNINGITNFSSVLDGDTLKVTFTLVTDYGDTDMDVEV